MKKIKILIIVLSILSTGHVYSQIQSVSGEWQFLVDSVKELAKIKLPGSCEEQGFGAKSTEKDPNRLTREFRYVGKAWYQETIEVPKEWQGKRLELFLERILTF
jgi:hypothetical protein